MSKAILNTLQSLEQPNKVVDVRDIAMYHETIAKQKTQIYQLLKKSCAEAGLTLVAGSFEEGATVTLKTEVVWQQATGKIFAWFQDATKTVAAGSTPATSGGVGAGAWVDRTDVTLRSDINIVQKRYACVADMIADTALSVGKIVETIGYHDGWEGTLDGPVGGNTFEIITTATPDGGSYIALTNGLFAKALFKDGTIDICQFGAKNETDSSQAILNAISFAATKAKSKTFNSFVGQASITVDATPGNYYIPTQITVPDSEINFNIRCTKGRVTFYGDATPTNKFLVLNQARNTVFENVNFLGFTTAVEFDTNNIDTNLIIFNSCEFNSCDLGVDTVSFAASRSTTLIFDKCRTGGTKRLVKSYCDLTIIRNGTFRSGSADDSFIYADSELVLDDNLFTPYVYPASTGRWIDITNEHSGAWGRASVSINRCRFGPEQSGGMPIIYSKLTNNTAQGSRTTRTHISINDSYCGAANTSTKQALIVLMNDTGATQTLSPNLISVRGGSWNAPAGAVVTESGITLNATVGQVLISLDATAQSGLGSVSTAPSTPLVGSDLEKYVASWLIDKKEITTTGAFTYPVGGRKTLYINSGSSATLTNLTDAMDGAEVCLRFNNTNVTVQDVSSGGSFRLAGKVNFTSSQYATLTVVYDRASGRWFEKARSVN